MFYIEILKTDISDTMLYVKNLIPVGFPRSKAMTNARHCSPSKKSMSCWKLKWLLSIFQKRDQHKFYEEKKSTFKCRKMKSFWVCSCTFNFHFNFLLMQEVLDQTISLLPSKDFVCYKFEYFPPKKVEREWGKRSG
jgi:hypothetical protein